MCLKMQAQFVGSILALAAFATSLSLVALYNLGSHPIDDLQCCTSYAELEEHTAEILAAADEYLANHPDGKRNGFNNQFAKGEPFDEYEAVLGLPFAPPKAEPERLHGDPGKVEQRKPVATDDNDVLQKRAKRTTDETEWIPVGTSGSPRLQRCLCSASGDVPGNNWTPWDDKIAQLSTRISPPGSSDNLRKGEKGLPGATGAPGPRGDTGDPGPPGSGGRAGRPGLAGQLCHKTPSGCTLQGPKGDMGDPGPPAPPGPPGPPSPQGPRGAQAQGPRGPRRRRSLLDSEVTGLCFGATSKMGGLRCAPKEPGQNRNEWYAMAGLAVLMNVAALYEVVLVSSKWLNDFKRR